MPRRPLSTNLDRPFEPPPRPRVPPGTDIPAPSATMAPRPRQEPGQEPAGSSGGDGGDPDYVDLDTLAGQYPDRSMDELVEAARETGFRGGIIGGERVEFDPRPDYSTQGGGLPEVSPLLRLEPEEAERVRAGDFDSVAGDVVEATERQALSAFLEARPDLFDLPPQAQDALGAILGSSVGLKGQLGALEGADLESLPEGLKTRLTETYQEWMDFRQERVQAFAPSWNKAFGSLSLNERRRALWELGVREDPPARWGREWLLELLGPQAQAEFAFLENAMLAAPLVENLGNLGEENYGLSDVQQAGRVLEVLSSARPVNEDFIGQGRLLEFMEKQVREMATEEGLAVEVPLDRPQWKLSPDNEVRQRYEALMDQREDIEEELKAGYRGPDEDRRKARQKALDKVASLSAEIEEMERDYGLGRKFYAGNAVFIRARKARDILQEVVRRRYGENLVEIADKAMELEQARLEAALEVFEAIDPSVLDVGGRKTDEMRIDDMEAMLSALRNGVPRNEIKGKWSFAQGLFDLLMAGSRAVGGTLTATGVTPVQDRYAYLFPDGSLFRDPIKAWKYSDQLWRANPEKAEWNYGPNGIKPQIITRTFEEAAEQHPELGKAMPGWAQVAYSVAGMDERRLAEASPWTRRIVHRDTFTALNERFGKSLAPDEFWRRAGVAVPSFLADVIFDPFNLATGGGAAAARSVARTRKMTKVLEKAGVEVSEDATKLGVKTISEIAAEVDQVSSKAAKRAAKSSHTPVALLDGSTLSVSGEARHTLMSRLLGGGERGEQMATELLTGAKRDPQFFARVRDMLVADPTTRKKVHLWFQRGTASNISEAEAVRAFDSLVPIFERVSRGSDGLSAFDRMRGWWLRAGTGDPAADLTKAKGLYLQGVFGTELFTTPVLSRARDFSTKIGNYAEKFAPESLKKLAEPRLKWLKDRALRRVAAGWRTDYVALKDPQTGAYLGTSVLPWDVHKAVAARRQSGEGTQVLVEHFMNSWARDEKTGAVLPEQARIHIGHMWEAGEGFEEGVEYAAFVEKLRSEVNAGRFDYAREPLPHPESLDREAAVQQVADQLQKDFEDIRATVTAEDIESVRRTMEPYRQNFERGRQQLAEQGRLGREAGIMDPIENYAPHIFREMEKGPRAAELMRQWESYGVDAIIPRPVRRATRRSLSHHTKARQGPPTMAEAMVLGLRPQEDMLIAGTARAHFFWEDYFNATMMRDVLNSQGVVRPGSGVAAARLIGDKLEYRLPATLQSTEEALSEVGKRAKDMEAEWVVLKESLQDIRKRKERLRSAVRKHVGKEKGESYEVSLARLREENTDIRMMAEELEVEQAAREAAVEDFSARWDVSLADQEYLLEHTTTPKDRLTFEIANLKRKLAKASGAEREAIQARLNALGPQREVYQEVREYFSRAGISGSDLSATTMALYNKPGIDFLTTEEALALRDRQAHLADILEVDYGQAGAAKHFEDQFDEALDAWIAAGRPDETYYARWTAKDQENALGDLKEMYLPVEIVMSLKSLGMRVGPDVAIRDTSRLMNFVRALDHMNTHFRSRVTVWSPAFDFGRRNQLDAFLKMGYYSGLRVASPHTWAQFNKLRRGDDFEVVSATGERLSSVDLRREMSQLAQTYERRMDVMKELRPGRGQTPAEASKQTAAEIAEQVERRGKFESRGWRTQMRINPGGGATGLRPPTAAQRAVPWGKGATEAADNEARFWIYFNERLAGRGPRTAAQNTADLARDYTNMTPFQQFFVSRVPIMFFNFHKQNVKSIVKMLQQVPMGRLAFPEKLLNAIEEDMPAEYRQDWMNTMDAIMGESGINVLMRDIGGVAVLDPYLNMAKALFTGNPMLMKESSADIVGGAPPASQFAGGMVLEQALGPEAMERLTAMNRVRVPQGLARKIHAAFGEGQNILFSTKEKGSQIQVEMSGWAQVILAMTGLGVMFRRVTRHADTIQSGDASRMLTELPGFAKFYPYKHQPVENMRFFLDALKANGDAMFTMDVVSNDLRVVDKNLTPQQTAVLRQLAEMDDAMRDSLDTLSKLRDALHGERGQIIREENR